MGSVIGLAPHTSPGTGNTTKLFYDGFGKTRLTNGPAPTLPSGTGGDFRFQGAWWESASDLDHMRAREYDQRMGRFMSRDPDEGGFRVPESINPYTFAFNNAQIYSDPTGEFTIIEINFSTALNATLQTMRTWGVKRLKQKAVEQLLGALEDFLWEQLTEFFPVDLSTFKGITGNFGNDFQHQAQKLVCAAFKKADIEDNYHFGVRIHNRGRKSGDPFTPGKHCPNKENPGRPGLQPVSWAVPDFIISSHPPYGVKGGMPSAFLVGDFKGASATLYNAYVRGGNRDQFTGIIDYAKKHTYSQTALFIVGFNNLGSHERGKQSPEWRKIRSLMGRQLTRRGVIGIVVSILN
jgi:RHS repeat-associated protein